MAKVEQDYEESGSDDKPKIPTRDVNYKKLKKKDKKERKRDNKDKRDKKGGLRAYDASTNYSLEEASSSSLPSTSDPKPTPIHAKSGCFANFKAKFKRNEKTTLASNDEDGSDNPTSSSARHSSVISQEIDKHLYRIEAGKSQRMSIGEKFIYVFCCVYCRPPDVTPEETPEERERREKIERLLKLKEIEMERLQNERLASEVKTVMYCKNAIYIPPPSPLHMAMDEEGEEEKEEEEEEKEGTEEQEEMTEKEKEPTTDVVIKVEVQAQVQPSSPTSSSTTSSTPSTVYPNEYLYTNAHNHNFYTAFGDSFQTTPMILISNYHTPASAAATYCDALFNYTSTLIAVKQQMCRSALTIQCAEKTRLAWCRVRQRKIEQAEER